MAIKGIIFDLDGTVLDTIEDIGDSMNQVLDGLGLEKLSYDEYKLRVGGGFRKLVGNILENLEEDQIDLQLKSLEAYYRKNYLNKSKPYDGIVDMLNILMDRGIKLAINTNKNQEYASEIIAKKFPNISFLDVLGVDERNYIKPDPRAGEEIIKKMGLDKDEVLYVGDSNVDIMTGKNLGIKTVGVDWGFRGEEELKRYGADHILYRPMDLIELL